MERFVQRNDLPPDLIRPQPGHHNLFVFDELMIEERIRELCFDRSS